MKPKKIQNVQNIQTVHSQRSDRAYLLFVVLLWIGYAVLTFIAPLSQRTFELYPQLTPLTLRLTQVTIVLPILFIWLASAYGAIKFNSYVQKIRNTEDGKGLAHIGLGLMLLLSSTLISGLFGTIRNQFPEIQEIRPIATIMTNLVNFFFPLTAFILIWLGSHRLVTKLVAVKPRVARILPMAVFLGLLAYLYVMLVFTNPNRQMADPGATASYYLSDPLILFLIVLPAIATWTFGVLAMLDLYHYGLNVSGTLYRDALKKLIFGLSTVILSFMFIQILGSFGSARLIGLSFSSLIGIIYVLLILMAVGYGLIASSAKRLKRLEEI